MKFMDAFRSRTKRRGGKADETASESVLSICVGDAGWSAELTAQGTVRWKAEETSAVEGAVASPPEQLGRAVAKFVAEQSQIPGRVLLSIDDPDLHLVDHRFARLSNFEPRAIRDFGSQQAGGRPIAFGSIPFGASGAREVEKRVLGFLPEEKLESYFFGLGKLATSLVSVTPSSVSALHPEFHQGGIFATLRVHGYFSTLLLANGDTGIVAFRQIPFGSLVLAKAYADEHGVSLGEASTALQLRSRLPSPAALKDGGSPEHKTATFAALAPVLRQMQDEITATLEYFRYGRLAGRPASLTLMFTATPIAGLQAWLGDAFEVQIETATDTLPVTEAPEGGGLNLLEGSRAGLLKLGHQPYEFIQGRFLPMKGAQSDKMPTKKAASLVPAAWLEAVRTRVAAKPIALSRNLVKPILYGTALAAAGVAANLLLLTGPAEERLQEQASSYGTAAITSVAATTNGSEAGLPVGERPNLWADTLLGVGKALSPPMKLERLQLAASGGKAGAGEANFAITGILPQGGANLSLVAGFIERLSQDQSFSRRFAQVRFTGVGGAQTQGGTQLPGLDAPQMEMQHETLFRVAGLAGGRK